MSSLDYLDLCRLCLVKDGVSVPIFEGETFLKISACLPVKVTREDKLPKKICHDCVCKVELFYDFCNTTANSEKQLLQLLGDVHMEDDKQNYIETVLSPNRMKSDENGKNNRLEDTVMQQVSEHQNSMNIMDNIMDMPMMISGTTQQQITSVPMDTTGESVQNIPVAGPSTQMTHEQVHINQNQSDTPMQQEEEEESSEEEENFEEECDADEGLPVKEESEEDPNNRRTVEPTTFVNVSLTCEEAGPSGLQQQKIPDIPDTMVLPQTEDVDPKTGNAIAAETYVKSELSVHEYMDPAASISIFVKEKETVRQEEYNVQRITASSEHGSSGVDNLVTQSELMENEGITCQSNSNAKKHSIDGQTIYECDICAKLFRSKNLFEGHLVAHSDARPYQCDVCNKSFKRTSTLAVHRRIHTHERNFVCDVCGRAFVQASQLATHHKRHFEKYTKHCEICNKGFFTNAELHGHMNVKHGAKEHVCAVCDKSFPNNHTLVRHMKIHDPNFKPVKHQCEFCGKTFAYKNSLVVHVKSHTGENKYDCHLCGKSVSSKGSLQDHLRLHGGEKSLVCDVCGKAFHKRTTLIVHKRTHTGEKPYSCDTCGKSFTQHSTLVIHKRYHTGQRPYQCNYCTKSFVSRGLLNAHNKIHTVNVMVVQPA